MTWLQPLLSALHWLGVALYAGSLVFLLLIFQSVYNRYRSYRYINNFRGEIVVLYWRLLHIAFGLIVLSGAALAGLRGKSVLQGLYGLAFSAKLALWLLQLWLVQDYLRPYLPENEANRSGTEILPDNVRPAVAVVLLLLIAVAGFGLKYL